MILPRPIYIDIVITLAKKLIETIGEQSKSKSKEKERTNENEHERSRKDGLL